MANNAYSFTKSEDDVETYYVFLTDLFKIYNVYFNASMYAQKIEAFPFLLENSFGFGFYTTSPKIKKLLNIDPRIPLTIHDIIVDFLNNQPAKTCILYHCDFGDGRQAPRNKLFGFWHEIFNNEGIIRQGLEVEIKNEGAGSTYHYIGFMTLKKNPNIKEAISELEKFSVDLVNTGMSK